jgi:hypothetical protein
MSWVGIAFVSVSYIILFVVGIVYAVPKAGGSWIDPVFIMRNSMATPTISVACGAISAATDLYAFLVPLSAISSLTLTTRKKIALSGLFATGLL